MTPPRAFTVACAAALPLIAGATWIAADGPLATRTWIAGSVLLVNVAVGEMVARRVTAGAHRGASASGLVVPVVVARQLAVLPVVGLLVAWLGALPTTLGAAIAVVGAGLHAVLHLLRGADIQRQLRPLESA